MFVLTQFNSASLNQHIKNTYHFDNFSQAFVDILAAEQTPSSNEWFQGTADAVKQSMHHTVNLDFDYILILSGDQLYQMNFNEMLAKHIELNSDISIATIPVTAKEATAFGIMKVNKAGKIDSFVEKPPIEELEKWTSEVGEEWTSQGKHYLASMGIYIFSKNILRGLFEKYPNFIDFGKEIIPAAINSGLNVTSYAYGGYWTDIGNIPSFFEANIELTDDVPKFNLFDNKNHVYTHPRMLAPSKISGTKIDKAIVADGCIIHADVIEQSVIGIRARIGHQTVLKRCIVMGNDYFETEEHLVPTESIKLGIGNNCYIENAIIDKNCKIGDGVKIIGGNGWEDVETEQYVVREGVIVLKKKAEIPAGTQIVAS